MFVYQTGVSGAEHESLIQTGLNALHSPFGPKVKYYENLVAVDAPDASTTGLPSNKLTTQVMDLIIGLGTRQILVSRGNCVVSERFREPITDYIATAIRLGLLPDNAQENVVYVDGGSLFQVSTIVTFLAEQGMSLVPYTQRKRLFELADESGCDVVGSGAAVAGGVVEALYNKRLYRDFKQDQHGPEAIPLPRCSINHARWTEAHAEQITKVLEYSYAYLEERKQHGQDDGSPFPVMFVQESVSGGGIGNSTVLDLRDGRYELATSFGNNKIFSSYSNLVQYFRSIAATSDLDITPRIPNSEFEVSYTIGISVVSNGVLVMGPFRQLLDPSSMEYLGWALDKEPKEDLYYDLKIHMQRSFEFGSYLKREGFEGYADEDLFQFRSPEGIQEVSYSESNVRRDGMTQLTGTLDQHSVLGPLFRKGELSIIALDHFALSTECLGSGPGNLILTSELTAKIRAAGISMVSHSNPYGVTIVSAPVPQAKDYPSSVGIAIIAPDDQTRDEWLNKLKTKIGFVSSKGKLEV